MEKIDVETAKFAGLFAVNGVLHNRVFVKKGREGYRLPESVPFLDWQELHDARTPEENESALAASMFGWDTPAAQPALKA